ncbi:Na+/H+ exchanger [Corchorus olitorius]|uniref:Na+/H+ exchanger n=1 Tax=Corchorus olitorius TaxID=93759 RepID=A0A1R3JWP0_9ROSI|nr:Na+/H+ exchanger [Corchorus olitorius]
MALLLSLSLHSPNPPQNPKLNTSIPTTILKTLSTKRQLIFNTSSLCFIFLTQQNPVPQSLAESSPPSKPALNIANTKSWFQFYGDGFAIRVPPEFEDIMEPEDFNAGASLYGDKVKPRTFAARFASTDGSEVLSVVIRPTNQLKITFLEAQDITDLGSIKDAAKIFVPGGSTLYNARTIKIKEDEGFKTYYFYEFGREEQHIALMAAVNSGKAIIAGATAPQSKWDDEGHLLEENRWANESITALLLGLCAGAVVLLVCKGSSSQILVFSEDLFFLYLLPPIIFNAGFQVKKKQFFKNFTIILMFGIVGTVISFCLISLGAFLLFKRIGVTSLNTQDYLAVGAILSATDSVCTLQVLSQDETPFLYSVVFGEGVVNDATSIVLFNSVQSIDFNNIDAIISLKLLGTFLYLFFSSTFLGIVVGLLSAFIIKTLYFGRHSTDREVALMMIMAYLSYMLAELLSLSGILTIFFCGIVMSHYTWHNVTESSRVTTKHAFATISFIAETFIFLYVGMDALDIDKWKASSASAGTSVAVSSTLFALVLLGRAAFVYPLANFMNCIRKRNTSKIELRQQFSDSEDSSTDSALMITSTIIVVLFSTVVFGSITKPLIEAVLLRHAKLNTSDATDSPSLDDLRITFIENGEPSYLGENQPEAMPKRSSLRLLMTHPTWTVHYLWRKFDDRFMRPVFGGRGFVPFVPGSPTGSTNETSRI